MIRRAATAALLGATAALLSGCVVAAIPLAAGAALAKRHGDLENRTAPSAPAAGSTVATPPAPGGTIVPTTLTRLPAPDAHEADAPAPSGGTIAQFAAYALAAVDGAGGRNPRMSALLARSSELRAERVQCAGLPPAVFIDLDPGRDAFDPMARHLAAPGLAAALEQLRGRGVAVVWFSRFGENFATPVREALAQSGLDPAGADRLVLMRDITERKQSRRDEIAAQLCPIAMLGDERADFDELFLYLRDPDAALALDALIGRGWFVVAPLTVSAIPPA